MRKTVYSGALKFTAVLLLIASIVSGLLVATNGVIAYHAQDAYIYAFEEDFSESRFLSSLLSTPESLMVSVYRAVFYEYNEMGYQTSQSDFVSGELRLEFEERIKEIFGEPNNFGKINYYIQWNDLEFTNCGAENAEEIMQDAYYSFFKRDSAGQVERRSTNKADMGQIPLLEDIESFDNSSTITVSCSIKEEAAAEYRAIWEKQEGIVTGTIVKTIICDITALLLFLYLLCVCGKNKDGEYKNMWLDNIWLEVHLAAIAGAALGAIALANVAAEDYMYGNFPQNLIYLVFGTVSALGSLIIITSLLSIVRNIKTRRLMETSLILRLIRWVVRSIVKIAKWIWKITKVFWLTIFRLLSKKTGVIFITMLFVYTAIIGFFGVCTILSPIWLVFGILVFVFACFVVAYRAKDFDEIKKGVSEVRNGNVGYKIPKLKCDDMKTLAGNINDIAIGLDESVAAKVKAERLKTELITNVSHDLKTPITSIISYTELLSKIEDLPEEARDYVAVIAKKSDRLKNLTQDLFDISKVQSGNENVVLEKIDVSLLINQALGEHDNEIQSSGLPFCVEAPKELYISADGRKMSRVLSNLISNILKYTMKNTRVFITAAEKDDMIEIELKNISAYPLNFNVEEITQRFVRGDESRTTEGNGLGLAIAKSYTEICNGTFELVVDGDMFKAILKFKKYN